MIRLNNYIIISILVLLISCAEKKQEPFSFVQLCDTQLGMGGYEHDLKSFKRAVTQINTLKPDFVVICGDLVNDRNNSSFADFKEIMEEFNMPCYTAPGNHDVGTVPNDTSLNYYRKTIGKDYYNFQHKGYSFIVVNTQLWKVDIESESEKHDNWFRETLKDKSMNDNPVFVIGHYPLYVETLEEEETYYNLPLIKRKEVLNLFKQNNVVAYLTGHTHKRVINSYDNIKLISEVTTSKNFDGNPLGFRVWEVSSDTITHHFISLQPIIIWQNEIEIN
ncbi:MAG: metallophosphoesterase [Bacteroidales bacterium]|nr:metallophosphoesterase [Bacteroidales bacterium]